MFSPLTYIGKMSYIILYFFHGTRVCDRHNASINYLHDLLSNIFIMWVCIGGQYKRTIAFHSWAKITWFYQSLNLSLHLNYIALGRSQNTLTYLGLGKTCLGCHFEDIICCCNSVLETIILRQIAFISNNTFVWWPSDCFSKALMHVCNHYDWMQNLETGVTIFHYLV